MLDFPRSLCAALALAVCGAALAASPGEDSGELASQYAAQVSAFLPVLDSPDQARLLSAALFDVRRSVAEIDQVVASAPPADPGAFDPDGVRASAATAHLHLAAFETRAGDFEGARHDVERARQLLGSRADTFRVPWTARQDGGPGRASVTEWELRTLPEFERVLSAAWSEARPVAFDLNTLDPEDVPTLVLSESAGSTSHDSDLPLIEHGAELFRDAVASGKRSFTIPLPPGFYRVGGRAGAGLDRPFLVPEASEPDPVVVGGERFVLHLAITGRMRNPRFFLNGVEMSDLNSLPYGYYRVDADRDIVKDAPTLIRFIPGLGIDNKSRTVWTVFVPAGEMTVLRFGTPAAGARVRD
jgi:hypothetical protein